ncbi:MAG: dicarboxylate/amino acid:cation symporter [Synergistaceae bacterium]|nr:dicarboxylate/amino acid:cation symporter [Synergistaceae bacterium]
MKKFPVTPQSPNDALNAALEYINTSLEKCRLKPKDKNKAALMAEESLLSLVKHSQFTEGSAIFVNFRQLFGNVSITLTVPGQEFNFAENLNIDVPFSDEGMPEAQEAVQNMLIRSFEDRLKYSHKKGFNTITVSAVISPRASFYWLMTALVSAIAASILLKAFTPESFYLPLNTTILVPAKMMFMNAVKTVVTPLIFCSIVTCLAQFKSFSEIGRVGAKITALFVFRMFLVAALGAGIFLLFQPGGGVNLSETSGAVVDVPSVPQGNFIADIVPSNLLRPFLEMNMMQLIFLSFLFGIGFSITGESAKPVREFLEASNRLFMAIVKLIMKFIPLAAFCSLLSALLTTDMRVIVSLGGFLAADVFGLACISVLSCLQVAVFAKLNPFVMLRKYYPTALIAAASSTSASIPNNMQACGEMGVPKRIYSFSIPLGATISLDAASMYTVLSALTLAKIYGISFGLSEILGVITSSAIIAISIPGITGAALVCISVVMSQLGVPAEALGLIMGVDALQNFLHPPINSISAIASTITVCAREGILDRDMFYSESEAQG